MLRTWLLRRAFLTKGRCLSRSLFCRICFSPWNRSGMARLPRLIPLLALLEAVIAFSGSSRSLFCLAGAQAWLTLTVCSAPSRDCGYDSSHGFWPLCGFYLDCDCVFCCEPDSFHDSELDYDPGSFRGSCCDCVDGSSLCSDSAFGWDACLLCDHHCYFYLLAAHLPPVFGETLLPFSFIETHANGLGLNSFINTHSFENNKCYLRIKSASSNDF